MDVVETNLSCKCNTFIKDGTPIKTDKYIYFTVTKLSIGNLEIQCPLSIPTGVLIRFSLFLPGKISFEILCNIDSCTQHKDNFIHSCTIIANSYLNQSIILEYIKESLDKTI